MNVWAITERQKIIGLEWCGIEFDDYALDDKIRKYIRAYKFGCLGHYLFKTNDINEVYASTMITTVFYGGSADIRCLNYFRSDNKNINMTHCFPRRCIMKLF